MKPQPSHLLRHSLPVSQRDKHGYSVGPLLLGFFLFVVVGSAFLQIIRTASMGQGPPGSEAAMEEAGEAAPEGGL